MYSEDIPKIYLLASIITYNLSGIFYFSFYNVTVREHQAYQGNFSEEETSEAATSSRVERQTKRSTAQNWRKEELTSEVPIFYPPTGLNSPILQLNAPYSYFKNFITDEFLDLIVQQTNLYSAQQNVNKPLNVTKNEIEQWLGLVMYFSIFKISDTRMHWSRSVAEFMNVAPYVMSRDRFDSIKKISMW